MRVILVVLTTGLLAAGVAQAQKHASAETVEAKERTDCITEGYEGYGHVGASIPDNDPSGVTMGPIETPEGESIEDVLLAVDIYHSYIGDLRLWLLYDSDCDGLSEVIGQVLCRSGMAECLPDGCCGCEATLDEGAWYTFDDAAAESIEETCTGAIMGGCYAPDYDSVGLDVFDGLESGGCFWLWAADGAGDDTGMLFSWAVWALYEGTPVEHSSWGTIKALYR